MIFTPDGSIDFTSLTESDKAAMFEINNSTKRAWTPENAKIALAMALHARHESMLRRVIKDQPAVFDGAGFKPLAYAIAANWTAGLEVMLKHTGGGIVNEKGQDALIFAAFFDASDCLGLALKVCDPKRVDHEGNSALNVALNTRGDHLFTNIAAKHFLLSNSDLGRENNEGLTPFDQAVRHGHFEVLAKLAPKTVATPQRFEDLLIAYREKKVPWSRRDTAMIDEFGARCDLPGEQREKYLRFAPKVALPRLFAQHEAWELQKVMEKTAQKSLTETDLALSGAPVQAASRRI